MLFSFSSLLLVVDFLTLLLCLYLLVVYPFLSSSSFSSHPSYSPFFLLSSFPLILFLPPPLQLNSSFISTLRLYTLSPPIPIPLILFSLTPPYPPPFILFHPFPPPFLPSQHIHPVLSCPVPAQTENALTMACQGGKAEIVEHLIDLGESTYRTVLYRTNINFSTDFDFFLFKYLSDFYFGVP